MCDKIRKGYNIWFKTLTNAVCVGETTPLSWCNKKSYFHCRWQVNLAMCTPLSHMWGCRHRFTNFQTRYSMHMCRQLRAPAASQREEDCLFPFSRSPVGPRASLFSSTRQHQFESSGSSSWEPQKLQSFDSWYCHNAVGFEGLVLP